MWCRLLRGNRGIASFIVTVVIVVTSTIVPDYTETYTICLPGRRDKQSYDIEVEVGLDHFDRTSRTVSTCNNEKERGLGLH